MATLQDRRIEQETMFRQIEDVLRHGRPEDPPAYTLVLGAGASFGAVPTAKQMLGIPDKGSLHKDCIPAFLHERQHRAKPTPEHLPEIVRAFWERFFAANPDLLIGRAEKGPAITRDAQGLPNNASIADAYKSIFDQRRTAGINTPSGAREYLRAITLRHTTEADRISPNGTHFFLASLLSLQNRISAGDVAEDGQRLYIGQRAFARTIFTTNFDPLLQLSLQLFQLLYYMTDRPELLAADGLHTDDHPAVHLFYAHGSVHRPFLANTEGEINHLHTNARDLAAYLGQHGVIVLGYSGWDDCLLRGMKEVNSFGNNLYWMTRGDSNAISPDVKTFLCSRPNAFWVPINDGGQFMAALHRRLCPGMPLTELLRNPIASIQRGLERLNLGEVEAPPIDTAAVDSVVGGSVVPMERLPSPEELRRQIVGLLEESARHFVDLTAVGSPEAQLKRLEHQADLSYAEEKWGAAIELYEKIISHPRTPAIVRARAHFRCGYAYSREARLDAAIASYSAAIDLPDVPVELMAKTLVNRGILYARQSVGENAIADFSSVVDLAGAPAETVASALVNRAIFYGSEGKDSEAVADYTRAIGLSDASIEAVASALVNRGAYYRKTGETSKAVADYSRAVGLPDAPVMQLAMALVNRAGCYIEQGKDTEALADYARAIGLTGAPPTQSATALINRGFFTFQQGDAAKAIADFSQAVELTGIYDDELAAALVNRANCYQELGDELKAIADCSRVIGLLAAPNEMLARAHYGLGLSLRKLGNSAVARREFKAALSIPGLPDDFAQLVQAALREI